ncbi:MAG: AAA family ATPase [Lachnospiraceae bacterium]|nr:AAA family ATPase [Lachnospiraceae bacterium]
MSIRILHTADWHIGKRRGPVIDGVNLREKDTELCVERVTEIAEMERPDITMVSGDLIDVAGTYSERGHHEERVVFRAISKLAKYSKYVIVLRGTPNHDGGEFFLALSDYCEQFENVSTVMEPRVVHTEFMDVACIPGFDIGYYRAKSPGLSKEEENIEFSIELNNICMGLKTLCSENLPSALMAHYTVPGCNTESGQSTFLQQFEPVLSSEALNTAGYDIVCLGHIHRPQQLPNVPNTFYAGAVNALNFNDEGQERGFYIHEFEDRFHINSRFMNTPHREFITLNLDVDDIHQINNGALGLVVAKWADKVTDKIVRIFYDSTEEDKKAFNRSLLEKKLLEDGAFMVWDIAPKNVVSEPNKKELGKRSDPEENLREFLSERQLPEDKILEITDKAKPVIQQALTNGNNFILTGEFVPVSIEVKNYRNYAEETFDFTDISFCTINGQNGAGKSSLFMDAIIDCLYEDPREGDKRGWIRKADGVRSGSITFTFRIGEQVYRVSRARTKSGTLTLSLSEKIEGEWENRTGNKSNDTQKTIEQILGMDSMTFKSCALIMQDQYGLFLEANKKERMGILSKLLGLEIYDTMHKTVAEKVKEYNAKANDLKQTIGIHETTMKECGEPEVMISVLSESVKEKEILLKAKTDERDKNKLVLTHQKEAVERRNKLLASITTLQSKKATIEQSKANQRAIVDSSAIILGEKAEIEEKVAEYKTLLQRELELAGESALYSSKKQETENLERQAVMEQEAIDTYRKRVGQKENELSLAQPTEQDAVVKEKAEQYTQKKAELEKMQEKAVAYQQAKTEYSAAVFHHEETMRKFDAEKQKADEQKNVLEKKVEILKESGCVDIDNAHCKFLQDAIEAKEELATLDGLYVDIAGRRDTELAKSKLAVDEKHAEMKAIEFDAATLTILQNECANLLPYVSQLEAINQRESKIVLLEADIKHLQSNILEAEKRVDKIRAEGIAAREERDLYADAFSRHSKVQSEIAALEPWLEKEKKLPVAEERHSTALNRISELTIELSNIDTEIAEKQAEADKELLAVSGIEELQAIVNGLETEVNAINANIRELQTEIGAWKQKEEQIKKLTTEINVLLEQKNKEATEAADYEILKDAFSYFGIPHQIVRTILPQLESTACQIIGQMTGGKMGISFQTERVQVSNKKEVLELDVFIEEYGKTALPYLSKSGGEKVKASLSVILALAEIKSSSAGIQLGMLFIDEPPFLDGDGIQAYCDALETIQKRYGNIKIMAITHDPTMKARFPQSLDVVKTDEGSKVIY